MTIKAKKFDENFVEHFMPIWRKNRIFYRVLYDSNDPESYSKLLLMSPSLPIHGELGYLGAKKIAKKYDLVLTTYDFAKERSETDELPVFQFKNSSFVEKEIDKGTQQLINACNELTGYLSKMEKAFSEQF